MGLQQYIVKRVLLVIPLLFGVSLVTFTLSYILPGNPATVRLGGSPAAEEIELMEEIMGLNKPLHVRYSIYLSNLLKGDWGVSWMTGRPVIEDISARLPATIELALIAFIIMIVCGVPLGIISAIKKNKAADHIARLISIGGVSIPLFWMGLILIYTLYFRIHWFPAPSGRLDPTLAPPETISGMFILDSLLTMNWKTLWSSLKHVALPAITLGFINLAPVARMVRSEMLDILSSNYILAERVAGVPEKEIYRDVLRNAMIPILTIIGICFGFLISEVIILEKVFAWPGIGLFALQSMASNDTDPIQAYILIIAFTFIFSNLLVDIAYAFIDPRIRYD